MKGLTAARIGPKHRAHLVTYRPSRSSIWKHVLVIDRCLRLTGWSFSLTWERLNFSGAMDPVSLKMNCPNAQADNPVQPYAFALSTHRYKAAPSCTWSTVAAQVYDGKRPLDGYVLHVWGGGVNRRMGISSRQPKSILVETPSKTRHAYHFAQLEDSNQRRISSVVPIDTYGPSKGKDCRQNQLTLVFSHMDADGQRTHSQRR